MNLMGWSLFKTALEESHSFFTIRGKFGVFCKTELPVWFYSEVERRMTESKGRK